MVRQPAQAITVIVPWCNRPELAATLRANSDWLRHAGARVLLVNCGGRSRWLSEHLKPIEGIEIEVLELRAQFNKGLAINVGLALAKTGLVMLLDADVVLHQFVRAATRFCTASSFVTLRRVQESEWQPRTGKIQMLRFSMTVKTSRRVEVVTSSVNLQTGRRSAPGILLARKEHLLDVNGLNSQLKGWGWEDVDLVTRLQLKLGLRHLQTGRGTHLSHRNSGRAFGPYRSRTESHLLNSEACLLQYDAGNLDGTLKEDLREWKDRLKGWVV